MNRFEERLMRDYPIRRKPTEKENVRSYLLHQLREMGYRSSLQSHRGAVNVIAGDAATARVLLCARYDTPLREPLPTFLCPTRPATYLLYQALTPVLTLLAGFAVSVGLSYALRLPGLALPLFLLLLVAALGYLRFGPSEKRNGNGNASGVAALLEIAAAVSPRSRGSVAFALLDSGAGMAGARGLKKEYPSLRETPVFVLDCVGEGDEILFLPNRTARWDGELLDAINDSFSVTEKKLCFLKTDGLVYYPSDNRAFRSAVTVCACKKVSGFGRLIRPNSSGYCGADEENLQILKSGFVRLIEKIAG